MSPLERLVGEHEAGTANHADRLWLLLNLEIWQRIFLDGEDPATDRLGMRPLRILWVKVGGLWPPNTGGRLRSSHMIAELSRRHRVSLITTRHPADDSTGLAARLPACERDRCHPLHAPQAGDGALRPGRGAILGLSVSRPTSGGGVSPRSGLGSGSGSPEGVDLCVADFLVAVPNVPAARPTPVVLFEHNVEYMIWKRLHEVEKRPWRRALLGLEWRKMRRYEARACARAGLTVAVSEADRALLAANAPGADIRAIGTGVDTTYFHPNGAVEAPASLVFTGSMDWYPNEDAILYFIAAILPRSVGRSPGSRWRWWDATRRTGCGRPARPPASR